MPLSGITTIELSAQTADPLRVPVTADGVVRATAVVDDVFVERRIPAGTIGGADWVAYLMARLGVRPIPMMPGFVVTVDSASIHLRSRIADLPAQTRAELGPLVGFLDPTTPISATILLQPAGALAARFHLETVSVNGFPIPDGFLLPYLSDIGRRYPMLTRTGRDLLIQVPQGGLLSLAPDSIHLSLP
ncbi:MAG: hypothetical protein ABJC74_10245 [Gemmatimonadota bacterium]